MMMKPLAMMKPVAAGLLSVALLATPAMAQVVVQEPGVVGYDYTSGPYAASGYGYGYTAGPGYYYGNRISPAPRVGAFATAPWDDGSYAYDYAVPY